MSEKSHFSISVCKQYLFSLLRKPLLVLPFFFLALIDYCALIVIYFAPRYPVSKILAPPIRKIWGEQFLHYPYNFSLIPKLYSYAQVLISFTAGIFFTAIFILFVAQLFNEKEKSKNIISKILIKASVKFIPMIIFFTFFYGLSQVFFRLAGILLVALISDQQILLAIQMIVNFIMSFILQVLFAFVFPAILIDNKGLISAFISNLKLVSSNLKTVSLLILMPSLFYILIMANWLSLPYFLKIFEPEYIMFSLSINIFLTVIIDLFITYFTTQFYMRIKK